MPPYQRFEDMPVWQIAADLYDQIDDFIAHAPPRLRHSFRAELERAALLVPNKIAEGYERGTPGELLSSLQTARSSAGLVRSMLIVAACRPYLTAQKSEISNLMNLAESCCRQLHTLAHSLEKPPDPEQALAHPDGRELLQRSRAPKPSAPKAASPA